MSQGDLTEAEWRSLLGSFATRAGRKSRSASNTRQIVNGILWRARAVSLGSM